MISTIGNDWDAILRDEFEKEYYKNLMQFLDEEYEKETVYPAKENVFNALRYSDYEKTKVVILGQDPYHEPDQAHGLCFSVNRGVKLPPSLVNIYKELEADMGITPTKDGCLIDWAKQGVLLLNTVLYVRRGQSTSHIGKGWEQFTDSVIARLNDKEEPVVFILWGSNAKSKAPLISNKHHFLLMGAHPSPLSAYNGFFGGGYFSKANRFLEITGRKPINWKL